MADDIATGESAERLTPPTVARAKAGTEGASTAASAARDRPDLAILVVGASRVVADRLDAAVEAAGVDDMRSAFGYVVRALAAQDRTLTELADLLGVAKQSAIKVVDEMERRGLLVRTAHPTDRRAKVLQLTPKGRIVREAALNESRAMEAELRASIGDEATGAVMDGLLAFLGAHGDATAALDGRARANW